MGFNSGFKGLTIIALPLQQWLHERALMLCYTYNACLGFDRFRSKRV